MEKKQERNVLYSALPHYGAATVRHAPSLVEGQRSFTRKLQQQLANRLAKDTDAAYAEAYVRICQVNDLAIFAVNDAAEKMKAAGMLRQGAKHHVRRAMAALSQYDKALEATLLRSGRMQYFMDMSDEFSDGMTPVIFRFRMAIKNFLDRHKEPQSEAKSYFLLAASLLWTAVNQWDSYWEGKRRSISIDVSDNFRAARLQGALSAWDSARQCIEWKYDGTMYDDADVDRGMKSVLIQINSAARINSAGHAALEKNPDRKRNADKIEKQESGKEATIW